MNNIEKSLNIEFYESLYLPLKKAIEEYDLVKENDRICVCISGGKDSMLMAKLFEMYKEKSNKQFALTFLVMNPGYNKKNLDLIMFNLDVMNIDAEIVNTDIFEITSMQEKSPCYLCAKMRRGALYRLAKERGCNKISLGHHYDDVIVTTLMNLLNSGSFQTMIPKLHSKNYIGMELIRPMFYIKEDDIIKFKEFNGLNFIACACKLTESIEYNDKESSQRLNTKKLIDKLELSIPSIKENIFNSAKNVDIENIVKYQVKNEK